MTRASEDPLVPQSAASPQADSAALVPAVWGGPVDPDAAASPALSGPAAYLHALRRRWWMAVPLGLLCAVVAGGVAWSLHKPSYTARALLRVSTAQESLVFETRDSAARRSFDIYKSTQQQLLKSDFVLLAALRKPEVSRLEIVGREQDPVRFLAESLRVEFPGNSELMAVRLSGDDPEQISTVVNAIVEAYLVEVVDREKNERRQRLDELNDLYVAKSDEMRRKRVDLKRLVEQVGSGDRDALALKQQIALEQFAELRRALVRAQFEVGRLESELRVQKANLEKFEQVEISDAEVASAARADPAMTALDERRTRLEALIEEYRQRVADSRVAQYLEKPQSDLQALRQEWADALQARKEELRRRRRDLLEERRADLETQLAMAVEQETQIQKDLEESRKRAEQFGGSSIEVEMMRAEISHLEGVLNPIAAERERLRVEVATAARVQRLQEARPPTVVDNESQAHRKVLLTGLAGFGLPFVGILFWEARKQRVNTPSDVTARLRLNLLGTLPPNLPKRWYPRLTKRNGRAQGAATVREAIDGIIASLLHETEARDSMAVLISSATSGEGKTTLATQLATGLARIGYRTLLLDFDLRRPALARLFGVPSAPGVSEVLRGETPLEAASQSTGIDRLSLLAAGSWTPRSLAVLAGEAIRRFFDEARRRFDFVVVDGGPVLPVAESRLLARHVDRVVLSVLRDVSRAPQVLAAREMLLAFGAPSVEAVVTGYWEEAYYSSDPEPAAQPELAGSAAVGAELS